MISPQLTELTGNIGNSAPATLQVDVIADFVCPWSFLGKRRLDEALAAVRGPSHVTWHPFQVNPAMPEQGEPFDDYLRSKFGDPENLRQGMEALIQSGVREGINFRFERIERVPSTVNAHLLMALGQEQECNTGVLADLIFHAFFERGQDISNADVLVRLGETVGLDARQIREELDSERLRLAVQANEARARQHGVNGVPDFLINQRLFVIGAQSTSDLVRIFDRAMFGEDSDLTMSLTVH